MKKNFKKGLHPPKTVLLLLHTKQMVKQKLTWRIK
ncbi:hypothetical protein CPT_Melville_088 [Salmonella phage Melville]|uniref:Uncharacterized protein n=1 Tax=Salmonella phage Melville TaxID=2041413 RepID=A0A2D1GLW9_9CAUD|nr:hypothetical protein FDI73_gp088 [Salmonella phage Melville]ATN93062.1 hypothetical protein CPT_Melville_088 [Salmonella phage Melville]